MRNRCNALAIVVGILVAAGVMAAADRPQERFSSATVSRIDRPNFVAAPGWVWLVRPQGFRPDELRPGKSFGQSGNDHLVTGYAHVDAEGGGLRVLIVQAGPPDPKVEFPMSRVVVLDAAGQRYLPGRPGGVISSGSFNKQAQTAHSSFLLERDVLPPEKVAYVGVEREALKAK